MLNDYFKLASNELDYYRASPKSSTFNNIRSVQCQQICEKLLKSVVQDFTSDESYLRTHKLKRIYDKICDNITLQISDVQALSMISEFYFDARYPGDDFIEVSDGDMLLTEKITEELFKVVSAYHSNKNSTSDISKLIDNAISEMNKR